MREFPGRQFEASIEAELLPAVEHVAEQVAAGGDRLVVTIRELVGLFGIADLAAFVVDPARLEARANAGVAPLLNDVDAWILAALVAWRGRDLDDVQHRTGLADKILQRRISHLRRQGALSVDSRGRLIRHPALVALGKLHAFEAKVRDWRKGLRQASTYQLWADTATLVLARLPTDARTAHSLTAKHGIGLAVEDRLVHRPAIPTKTAGRRLLASEHAWAAIAPYFTQA